MDVRHVYSIEKLTDTFVLISDQNNGLSVTNAAKYVTSNLEEDIQDGLGNRKVYYRDSTGQYDELKHMNGHFTGFAPCTENQQEFFKQFPLKVKTVTDFGAGVPWDIGNG